jgi:ubiquitin carboxyl-terminal hydrolase 34
MLDSDDSPVIMLSAEDDIGSPPVVLIDDDEPTEDERLDAEKYFRRFPYTENGDYHTAVRDLAQYIQGSTSS